MRVIRSCSPVPAVRAFLVARQALVNAGATYPDKIALAKSQWELVNRNTNAVFIDIRSVLSEINGDIHRCAYCEDSLADEIEHIYPKAFFPSVVFDWNNFLRACGSCNRAKVAQFSLLTPGGLAVLNTKTPPTIEPPALNSLLINPKIEDPFDYLALDLKDTFHFVAIGAVPSRGEYTINTLKLNSREGLVAARRAALDIYHDCFYRYDKEKQAGAPQVKLAKIAHRICFEIGHSTVWHEIKRQCSRAPWLAEFNTLFATHPEALLW